jgi:diguanylate cyclase
MLREMSQRLRESSPGHALVARPGGDEFVVIVPGPRAAAVQVTQALLQALAMPLTLEGRMVVPGASIGLAHAPDDGRTASDLLRRADMAMYSAKAAGGGRSAWFAPTLDEQLAERTALLDELNRALERDEFELYYQPRVAASTGVVRSAEALLRWRHPMRGVVPPARFIDLLEETGQIDRVGMWAIDTACRQLVAWRAQGLALDALAVNVSTRQLKSPTFVDQVTATLGRHALPASSLELEITESIFMGDSSIAIAAVHALSQVGIRIALDDFGTGYSSLSYLQKLPIGILKVDRSFVTELGQRDSALAVTRSIIALARALHLQVVAEGVETWQQTDLLVELGCDELQGYLFAEPLACDDFARHARRPAIQLKAASPIEA